MKSFQTKAGRRQFFKQSCATCLGFSPLYALAQAPSGQTRASTPKRFDKPSLDTDEGGLWALMEREEKKLRRSHFVIKSGDLNDYVTSIACKLGADHCPDIRVHLIRTPGFNASMAPNGMMQVWSGLMLRVENEAQIAAILGHEIAHYYERHALARLRDAKDKSAVAIVLLSLVGFGALGAMSVLAGSSGFSRDQEREADRIGMQLMAESGYDTRQAALIWKNLFDEIKAGTRSDTLTVNPFTASHPGISERIVTLSELGAKSPDNPRTAQLEWLEKIAPYRLDWINDEIKRGQHEESLVLFDRLLKIERPQPELQYAKGEVPRSRGKGQDLENALISLNQAIAMQNPPHETYRSLGLVHKSLNAVPAAQEALKKYLELVPQAQDAGLIRGYLQELNGEN